VVFFGLVGQAAKKSALTLKPENFERPFMRTRLGLIRMGEVSLKAPN
jgi:hypothetical protein